MEHFTPVSSAIGGALIGLSAAILWLGNGRIAGISGIFGQLLPPTNAVVWQLIFLGSMVFGALISAVLLPGLQHTPTTLVSPPAWFSGGTPLWIAIAGLLTGFGTKIGNGCTSGHGICGLARLSRRSFVAVAVFFVVAILTVTITGIV